MVPDTGIDPVRETYEVSVLPLYESGKNLQAAYVVIN